MRKLEGKSHLEIRTELRSMAIHEWRILDDGYTSVLRVASGWIYYRWNDKDQDYTQTGVFVPYY